MGSVLKRYHRTPVRTDERFGLESAVNCFILKVNLLPLAGVRGHCVEKQTRLLMHHDIHHKPCLNNRISSLQYNQDYYLLLLFSIPCESSVQPAASASRLAVSRRKNVCLKVS